MKNDTALTAHDLTRLVVCVRMAQRVGTAPGSDVSAPATDDLSRLYEKLTDLLAVTPDDSGVPGPVVPGWQYYVDDHSSAHDTRRVVVDQVIFSNAIAREVGFDDQPFFMIPTSSLRPCACPWLRQDHATISRAQSAARLHYRAGEGLDSNPYDKTTRQAEHQAFAWEMHRIQREQLVADINTGVGVSNDDA